MALDATVGGSDSNSYVTRAEANSYFTAGVHPKASVWSALSDNQKDQFLIMATTHIDALKIKGGKYTTTMTSGVPDQALKFPRAGDYDNGTTFIPAEVKKACYEQAIYLAENLDSQQTRANLQRQGVRSASVGDVSESYTGRGGRLLCDLAYRILLDASLVLVVGKQAA